MPWRRNSSPSSTFGLLALAQGAEGLVQPAGVHGQLPPVPAPAARVRPPGQRARSSLFGGRGGIRHLKGGNSRTERWTGWPRQAGGPSKAAGKVVFRPAVAPHEAHASSRCQAERGGVLEHVVEAAGGGKVRSVTWIKDIAHFSFQTGAAASKKISHAGASPCAQYPPAPKGQAIRCARKAGSRPQAGLPAEVPCRGAHTPDPPTKAGRSVFAPVSISRKTCACSHARFDPK